MVNTVSMVFQTGTITERQSAAAYERRMTGEGDPCHARQIRKVVCGEWGAELAAASMAAHLQTHHGRLGQVIQIL